MSAEICPRLVSNDSRGSGEPLYDCVCHGEAVYSKFTAQRNTPRVQLIVFIVSTCWRSELG